MFDFIKPALFWSKVDRTGGADACWPWMRYCSPDGYGKFAWRAAGRNVNMNAHRVAVALTRGLQGEEPIDHLCRNRLCCNPAHLEQVSTTENNRRGYGWAGVNARKQTCPAGHELSGANVIILRTPNKADGRGCRICRRATTQRWRARKALLATEPTA